MSNEILYDVRHPELEKMDVGADVEPMEVGAEVAAAGGAAVLEGAEKR